jgi:pimeloyl-ACP methyl ester carboxylesterase
VSVWELDALSVSVGANRVLEVVCAGPPDGLPLFSHHGTPGAAEMFDPLVAVGAERGFRHITYSRPGYGGSGRFPRRTVADCVVDVAAVADALGYEQFYSAGSSGGGPHSIACTALLPERVIAAASIASPAPIGADGLDWIADMGDENVAELAASQTSDDEFQAYLEQQAKAMAGVSADEIMTVLGDVVSEVDQRALSGVLGEFIARETTHALSRGVWGWFDDDRAILGDWGFDLDEIRAPLSLWHGGQDRFVPIAHGEWLAAHVVADAHLLPEHGHLSLSLSSYGEILDCLLALGSA